MVIYLEQMYFEIRCKLTSETWTTYYFLWVNSLNTFVPLNIFWINYFSPLMWTFTAVPCLYLPCFVLLIAARENFLKYISVLLKILHGFSEDCKIPEGKDSVSSISLSIWYFWVYTNAISKARWKFHLCLESHLYSEQNSVHCLWWNLRHDIPFALC